MSQERIDTLLQEVRDWNDAVESYEDQIRDLVHLKNERCGFKAEALGRLAFLEGRKKGRNPFQAPLSRNWNIGWESERQASLTTATESPK